MEMKRRSQMLIERCSVFAAVCFWERRANDFIYAVDFHGGVQETAVDMDGQGVNNTENIFPLISEDGNQ